MSSKIKMTTTMFLLLLMGISYGSSPVNAVITYTAHVKWTHVDNTDNTDCGDGTGINCEDRMRVYRTASSSCASKSWYSTTYETIGASGYVVLSKQLTWSRSGGFPCLDFRVKFHEDTAGDVTTTRDLSVPSDYSVSDPYNLALTAGSANGQFTIIYWLTWSGPWE